MTAYETLSAAAGRGAAIICIDLGADDRATAATLESIRTHTPRDVRIQVCSVHELADGAGTADVVLVRSGCLVGDGWLDGLRAAAYSDSTVASASALSVEVAPRVYEHDAAAVRERSLRLHPRLQAPGEVCVYLRRSALELAGGFEGAERFAQRCVERGLCHVLADEVLVSGVGYSTLAGWARADPMGGLARSLGAARRARMGLSVLVDARVLSGPMNGTRLHVLELVSALARGGEARVEALVPDALDEPAMTALEAIPQITLVTSGSVALAAASHRGPRADVVHRPFQLSAPADLGFLMRLADRLVVTQEDLISFYSAPYFASRAEWARYRELVRRSLAVADRVVFSTEHARRAALADGLVERARSSVVSLGVDHAILPSSNSQGAKPARVAVIAPDAETMLCLGTDYQHKNRLFALQLLEQLQQRHGWPGWLILAGPPVACGSSRADEQQFLSTRPSVAQRVLELGEVSEAEKIWLLRHARAVLYPTLHEGFGFVPFEAADHGAPCLWAPGTSLSELLPDELSILVPWDVVASADRTIKLLGDERARTSLAHAVGEAASRLRWTRTASELIRVYTSTCEEPPNPAGIRERADGVLRDGFSEDAIRLVGPDGALPEELERPLLALANHPHIARPLFQMLAAGYRASKRWRRRI